jgi:hypothetical protein
MLETTPFYTTVDVLWPALYFSSSYWTWWVILAGLLIELPVVIWSFKLPLKKAIVADLLMNAASAVVGMVALAIAGIGWEIFPGTLLYKLFNLGTFNPITWSATFILAAMINTAIEGFLLRFVFKTQLTVPRLLLLGVANAVTIFLAAVEMWWHPPQL